ncbi:hypothetical protein [Variovorax sp. LT1R16]|uniref:hypothetical protein n=1 Tax=Variovorax sp. LT1R16 TaxID=3443728 RepID=UPI003F481722
MMKMNLCRRLALIMGAPSLSTRRTEIEQQGADDAPSATPAWPTQTARSQPCSDSSNSPSRLHWRDRWWAWLLASWLLTTLLAPTFWIIGILLALDSRSDHPAFWPLLMGSVALTHAVTIVCVNQRQHRKAYVCREGLARHYCGISQRIGAVFFLGVGWGSGFLPALTLPTAQIHFSLVATATALMWNALLAWLFSLSSFAHAGVIYARLGFAYRRCSVQT